MLVLHISYTVIGNDNSCINITTYCFFLLVHSCLRYGKGCECNTKEADGGNDCEDCGESKVEAQGMEQLGSQETKHPPGGLGNGPNCFLLLGREKFTL